MKIAAWCEKYHVMFKINSVINCHNVHEDFAEHITALAPFRWKVFQVLPVDTENMGEGALTDVSKFVITGEEFEDFCARHGDVKCLVKESNSMMRSSYIILDEYMRFIINSKITPKSILDDDADVPALLASTKYKHKKFVDRGGVYEWTRERSGYCQTPEELQW
jgi:radical S-adenosyl methionine domain-containing protein 2